VVLLLRRSIPSLLLLLAAPAAARAAPPASAPAALAPLRAAQLRELRAIPSDAPKDKLIFKQHFVISNELRPYLFYRAATPAPRGGMLLGVGAEQNYLFASWYRSELVVVLDFDPWIVDLHGIYALVFRRAPSADEFLRLWSAPARRELEAAIAAEPLADAERKRWLLVLRTSREKIEQRLRSIKREFPRARVQTFLTSGEQYQHLAALARARRLHALHGDFTGGRTLRELAAWARRARLPLSVLYLSNVEWYFDYAQGRYRQNILDFALAQPALVLQTSPVAKDRYAYVFQSGATYHEWLRCQCVASLRKLLAHATWHRSHGRGSSAPLGEHVMELRKRPAEVRPRARNP
jgi:hypothetical protein